MTSASDIQRALAERDAPESTIVHVEFTGDCNIPLNDLLRMTICFHHPEFGDIFLVGMRVICGKVLASAWNRRFARAFEREILPTVTIDLNSLGKVDEASMHPAVARAESNNGDPGYHGPVGPHLDTILLAAEAERKRS